MSKLGEVVSRLRASIREDGWINTVTGLGLPGYDRTASGAFVADPWMSRDECAVLYHHDAIAARIVQALPHHALRGGVNLVGPGASTVLARMRALSILPRLTEGFVWGRAVGGAIGVLGFAGEDPKTPMSGISPGSFQLLDIYDARDVQLDTYSDLYIIQQTGPRGMKRIEVHPSRTIRFPGEPTGDRERQELQGWDASVLQRARQPLTDFHAWHRAVGLLMSEASVGVFSMAGLLDKIAANGLADLVTRAQTMDLTRSISKSVMLDADRGESYRRETVNFGGLSDVLDRAANLLAASVGMPVTVIMGTSPAGMNATGASDIRIFYDSVSSYRRDEIEPVLDRIIDTISQSEQVEKPTLSWPSLWQESPAELAARRKTVADTDAVYWNLGALSEDDIRASRWRPEGYSDETIAPTIATGSLLPADGAPEVEEKAIPVTPTDIATVTTVNELRASIKLSPMAEPFGSMTLPQYQAATSGDIAAAEGAKAGSVDAPPQE